MRYAIISDVHANLEALTAVLNELGRLGADKIICLGDLVGINVNPNECVDLIRVRNIQSVIGNHDQASIGVIEPDRFTPLCKEAVYWTRKQISPETVQFLSGLPSHVIVDNMFVIVHAALHPVPNQDGRLNSTEAILESFSALGRDFPGMKLCFLGHTHVPVAYELRDGTVQTHTKASLKLHPDSCYLINPGSVGHPRDRDTRSSFALYDSSSSTVSFHRVSYDVRACNEKVTAAGLCYYEEAPETWRERLSAFFHRIHESVRAAL